MAPIISVSAGGIDVESMVSALMQVERQPIVLLQSRQSTAQAQANALAKLRTNLDSLKSLAASVVSGGVSKLSSNVSVPGAVTASLSPTARAGSLSFTVDRLAQAHGLRTTNNVASATSTITTANALAISTSAGALGIGGIQVGSGVATGNHTVSVVQATSGAVASGTAALASSTVIDASNNTLQFELDGVVHDITLADGTYTPTGLVAAVQSGIDAAGGGATASLDTDGRLRLTTTHEGSAATIEITGGTALGALGLVADGTVTTGTDGSVKIGDEPPVAVTSAGLPGSTLAVPTGSGNLTLTVDGPLRTGDATVAVVSTGDRSLSAVAAAINSTNVGASAAAVRVADGAWVLQVTSARTGTDHALSLDAAAFGAAGGLVQTSAAQDASITIGSGAGAYSVTASGNTFTDVLPGVTLTATAESTTPVTVSVSRDETATADAVQKLVTGINSLLGEIKTQTAYGTSGTSALLARDPSVRRLADQVRSAVTSLVGSSYLASNIGITTTRTGTLEFDKDKFLTALQNDPAAVERTFARGGTAQAPGLTFGKATDKTVAGTYDIVIDKAATRAASSESLIGGTATARSISVTVGTISASYDAAAGASAADIVAGLNAAMAASGIKVNAEVGTGGGVTLAAVGYGASGSFTSDISGAVATYTGTDVVGTIDGRDATGIGQRLYLGDTSDSLARGLEVTVDGGVSGLIKFDYQPGIAGRLVSLAVNQTAEFGSLNTAKTSYERKIEDFNTQIERFEARMQTREASMRRQWTAVQTLLASMESQGNWLGSQIAGMSGQSQ